MKNSINVLMVEDNEDDAELVKYVLKKAGYAVRCHRVQTQSDFEGALEKQLWDLIICDYRLPGFTGIEALDIYRNRELDIPFVFVSGTMGEEVAVDAMTKGAHDYVMKNNMARLIPAIERELKEAKVRFERRQAIEALRTSESSLQSVLRSTADGILAVDAENRVLFANDRFSELTNIPAEIMANKDDSALIRHVLAQLVDPQVFLQKVQELYKSREESFDTLLLKDGRVFERLSRPLMDGEEIRGRVWSFRDVTERNRSEERLRASEAYYKTLTEASPDAIVVADTSGTVAFASPKTLELFGFPPDGTHVGTNLLTWISPEYHEIIKSRLQAILSHRATGAQRELVLLKHDGTPFWGDINSSSILDENENVVGVLVVCRDITERKRAEEALAQERHLLRTLIDNIPDHIYFKDVQRRFIRINMALAKSFGLRDPEEAFGKTDADFFSQEHATRASEDEQNIIRTGKPIVGLEEKETWPDGKETWVLTTKMPLNDKDGDIAGTFGVSRDITDRKQAETDLVHKIEDLQRFQNLTVDRELKMIQLKKEVNELLKRAGQPAKYKIAE